MSCVAIQPGLVASVELVSDAVQRVRAQDAGVLVVVKPCDLKAVPVDEQSDGVAFLWAEQVVAYHCHAEQRINFLLVDAQIE